MEQTKKKSKAGKVILIIVACILGVALLFVLGVRAYFRIPVAEYYKNSKKAFVIPGLNDGMTHQGLAYNDNEFFITGYRSDGEASQVSIVDKESGKETKRVSLLDSDGNKFLGHVGGITVWENYDFVSDGKVKDQNARAQAIQRIIDLACSMGYEFIDGVDSDTPGAKKGNIEYLAWLRWTAPLLNETETPT